MTPRRSTALTLPVPVIETARLRLVPFNADFARALLDGDRSALAAFLDAHVPSDWIGPSDYPLKSYLADDAKEPFARNTLTRVLVAREEKQVLGDIMFFDAGGGNIHVQINVLPAWRNQGYGTEALQALTAWTWVNLDLPALYAYGDKNDLALLRVMEKAGYVVVWDENNVLSWQAERP